MLPAPRLDDDDDDDDDALTLAHSPEISRVMATQAIIHRQKGVLMEKTNKYKMKTCTAVPVRRERGVIDAVVGGGFHY